MSCRATEDGILELYTEPYFQYPILLMRFVQDPEPLVLDVEVFPNRDEGHFIVADPRHLHGVRTRFTASWI